MLDQTPPRTALEVLKSWLYPGEPCQLHLLGCQAPSDGDQRHHFVTRQDVNRSPEPRVRRGTDASRQDSPGCRGHLPGVHPYPTKHWERDHLELDVERIPWQALSMVQRSLGITQEEQMSGLLHPNSRASNSAGIQIRVEL